MPPRAHRLAAAALVAALALPAARACEVQVRAARTGAALQTIGLGALREVELSYLHSVTRTVVRETLALDGLGFVQQRIEFSVPGPGLPTEALPGEVFERQADRFVYRQMERRVGVLHMRVDPAQAQTLSAGGVHHPLTAWGAIGLQLSPSGCQRDPA